MGISVLADGCCTCIYINLKILYFHLQPPPPPRIKSKMDSLIFMSDSVKTTRLEESVAVNNRHSEPQSDAPAIRKDVNEKEIEVEVEAENVERPVDLYKVLCFLFK